MTNEIPAIESAGINIGTAASDCGSARDAWIEHERAVCPECESVMPITAEHNGVAWVGHGICPMCGWASQHPLPDKPNKGLSNNKGGEG